HGPNVDFSAFSRPARPFVPFSTVLLVLISGEPAGRAHLSQMSQSFRTACSHFGRFAYFWPERPRLFRAALTHFAR
ncbi:hypothetical protein KI387_012516, partial [Taxus chinensis]